MKLNQAKNAEFTAKRTMLEL